MTATQFISEEQFAKRYPLLPNHLNPAAPWALEDGCGRLFEPHGDEFDFVRRCNSRQVWTLVDADDGTMQIRSGLRLVNRLGYFVSTVAVPQNDDVLVFLSDLAYLPLSKGSNL